MPCTIMTLSINYRYADCHNAEFRDYSNVLLSVVMQNEVMLIIAKLNVVMMSAVTQGVVAPVG